MKIAYLVLSHNNSVHFKKLINELNTDETGFYVHIDRNANIKPFSLSIKKNVFFLKERTPVYWGDFSIVDATMALIKSAMDSKNSYEYFVLISGTDFPIQPAWYINRFFEMNSGKEFINLVEMPNEQLNKPISRITTYFPRIGGSKLRKFVLRTAFKCADFLPKRNYQKVFNHKRPYAGSGWWALSRKACEYILYFSEVEDKFVKFFKNSIIPDESFFHTIIGNSHFKKYVHRNLTYTKWKKGSSSPSIINEDDLEFFEKNFRYMIEDGYGKGELLFARKFNDQSHDIVSKIIKNNEQKKIV